MNRTSLLLGILLLLGAAAAWLALGGGGEPALPGGPGETGLSRPAGEEGGGPAPLRAGRKRLSGKPPGKDRPRKKEEKKRVLEIQLVLPLQAGGNAQARIGLFAPGRGILARARSGADGRARLVLPASLPPGAFLQVDHPRCLPWKGSPPEGEDLLQVRLQAAARLEGRVLGKDGRPAAGARVFLEGSGGEAEETARSLTGKDGTFRLERIPPGRIRVTCILGAESRAKEVLLEPGRRGEVLFDFTPRGPLLEGFLEDGTGAPLEGRWLEILEARGKGRVLVRTGRGGAFRAELTGPGRVDLFAAEKKDAAAPRIALGSYQVGEEGLSGLRLALGPCGISGRVRTEEGGELPRGSVAAAWRRVGGDFRLAGQTETFDEEGRFLLKGLKAGAYRLSIQARGYPDLLVWVGPLERGLRDLGELVLTRKGTGDLLIRTRGKGGPPPRTFRIARREGDAWVPLDLVPRGKNRFLARALPAGPTVLRVEAQGFVPGEMEVEIGAGRISRITLEFLRGYPVTLEVTGPGGTPVEGVWGRFSPQGPWIRAKDEGGGLWTFPSLPPGTYTLLVKAQGLKPAALEIRVPAAERPAARIELGR